MGNAHEEAGCTWGGQDGSACLVKRTWGGNVVRAGYNGCVCVCVRAEMLFTK